MRDKDSIKLGMFIPMLCYIYFSHVHESTKNGNLFESMKISIF